MLPIQMLVEPILDGPERHVIVLVGPRGSGKSSALQFLKSIYGSRPGILFKDGFEVRSMEKDLDAALEALRSAWKVPEYRIAVITASHHPAPTGACTVIEMSGWGDDDAIEYLLAVHPARCHAVMPRLLADPRHSALLGGRPILWRAVLDELAADDAVPDVAQALRNWLDRIVTGDERMQLALDALNLICTGRESSRLRELADSWPILRHRAVMTVLASEAVMGELECEADRESLSASLSKDLVLVTATLVSRRPSNLETLKKLGRDMEGHSRSTVASILIAIDPDWRPVTARRVGLDRARLPGVRWAGLELTEASLTSADLSDADLSGASMTSAQLDHANLRRARLASARLEKACFFEALLDAADLSRARLTGATLVFASLEQATLRDACLVETQLRNASLADADLRGADLSGATLHRVRLSNADLRGARLQGVNANDVVFRESRLDGAVFAAAKLHRCDFEGVELHEPDFEKADLTGAYLTDSVMPLADFRGAKFRNAGLAGIAWEGADLREADFTGASFHLGSSRSGLVESPIASEGTRTGFYTNDADEWTFKSPEEIRRADLRGADLRGAKILETDWYLVDLRGAQYSPDQEAHFRHCRAILRNQHAV